MQQNQKNPVPPSPQSELDARWAKHELDLTLLVPCLNEAPRVTGVLDNLQEVMASLPFSYEVIVVDDGSTDNTSGVVSEYLESRPGAPIRLFRNPINLGVARTFMDAVFYAKGKYIRLQGGDNPEPREATKAVFSQMGKADVIIPYSGARYVKGKGIFRNLLSKFYTLLVNLCSGYSLHYYNGSPVFLRYHAMRWAPNNRGFTGFMADLVTHLIDEGATYIQVEVIVGHVTKTGNSPITFVNCASTAHTLLEILIRRIGHWVFRRRTGQGTPPNRERESRDTSLQSMRSSTILVPDNGAVEEPTTHAAPHV